MFEDLSSLVLQALLLLGFEVEEIEKVAFLVWVNYNVG